MPTHHGNSRSADYVTLILVLLPLVLAIGQSIYRVTEVYVKHSTTKMHRLSLHGGAERKLSEDQTGSLAGLQNPNLHGKNLCRYSSKSSQERRTSIPVTSLAAILPRRSVCVISLRTKHGPKIAFRSPPRGLCISGQVVPVIWTRMSCTFPSDKLVRGVNGFIQNRHRPSA